MGCRKDITGLRVGKLIVVAPAGQDKHGRWVWLCRCDCGGTVERDSAILVKAATRGNPSNCGCRHHKHKHGLRAAGHRSRLYNVWTAMRGRCLRPANKDFSRYGGRGITVCGEWRDFATFHGWALAAGYERGLTIERVDVDGPYAPGNCTWIPNARQALNWGHSRRYTFLGETKDIRSWAAEYGLNYYTLRARLTTYGWGIADALTVRARPRVR